MAKQKKLSEEIKKQEEKKLAKAAEAESLVTEEGVDDKKKKLLERAKKLEQKLEKTETKEIVEKVTPKKKEKTLLPLDDYVKSGIYLGTRVVTPNMRKYVYRRRADGLAILNTDIIDEKLKEGIEFLSKFAPEDVIIVCKRQAGWKAVELFSKFTGIRAFTKKYPAGILTNTQLPDFFETQLVIICDSWLDKNALNDAKKVHTKVLQICDTNNFCQYAEKIVIGNNKSPKSLGLIFYLLTKGYCEKRSIKNETKIPDLDFWMSGEEAKPVK